MRHFVLIWTIVCLSIAGPHHASLATDVSPPALPHVAEHIAAHLPLRIIAFGSSSTEGIGATSSDHTYPSQLQIILSAKLPQTVVLNRGIGGEDVDDMMRRLPAMMQEKPDLVIWQTGSNDELRAVPLEHFIGATRAGISRMQSAGIDVMLMEPQVSERLRLTAQSDVFREAVRELGREMGVPVIRRYDLMQQWLASGQLTYNEMMSNDKLHMTDGGYAALARAVADLILLDRGNAAPSAPGDAHQVVAHQSGPPGQ